MLNKFAVLALFFASLTYAADGTHGESELGLVSTAGNSRASTFDLKESMTYEWDSNLMKFFGTYLDTTTNSVESARSWNLGLRYERILTERWNGFLGQAIESDIFAGYAQRYNSDVGLKYTITKEELFNWSAEAGYRYTIENRLIAAQATIGFLRAYSEADRSVSKTTHLKLSAEYLPDLSNFSNFRLNSELSVIVLMSEVFSIKSGYLVKYINIPLAANLVTTDSIFTTALVGKF